MKKIITLLAVLFLLTACTNETNGEKEKKEATDQHSTAANLTIAPAELTDREQSIVKQVGGDYTSFFTIEGVLKEGVVLKESIVVYKNGEKTQKMVTMAGTGEEKEFKSALHSFGIQTGKDTSYLTIGSPGGHAGTTLTIPEELGAFMYHESDKPTELKKGEAVYWAYFVGTSENQLTSDFQNDLTILPESVKKAEFAIVFQMEVTGAEKMPGIE